MRGHSTTTWCEIFPIVTPYSPRVDILHVSEQAWSFYWKPTHLLSTQLLNAPFCTMGSNTFLIFLQIIFDEIFNYGPFPIGIMNWIFRSVMIKNNPSKNNSFNCCAFSYFYKYTWPLIDHIFIWFEEVLMLRTRQNFAGNCHIKTQ